MTHHYNDNCSENNNMQREVTNVQRMVLRFSKALNAKASFAIKPSSDLRDVHYLEIESISVSGIAPTSGSDPTPITKIVGVNLELNGNNYETITEDGPYTGFTEFLDNAPHNVIRYQHPCVRRFYLKGAPEKIRATRITFTDQTLGAADISAPQFTDIAIAIRVVRLQDLTAAE